MSRDFVDPRCLPGLNGPAYQQNFRGDNMKIIEPDFKHRYKYIVADRVLACIWTTCLPVKLLTYYKNFVPKRD